MAKKQITLFIDDLTGEESADVSTVTFAIDGTSYEIDLSPANADKMSAALQPYISAARRTGGRTRRSSTASSSAASKPGQIREWATAEGIEVPARGRIPRSVIEQYEAAH